MLDDFFTRALIAGIALALTTGPLGCFVVWRRMAYFGATMAHAALLGVAMGLFLGIAPMGGVFLVAVLVAGGLLLLERIEGLSSDALLGILAHASLAVGLVAISTMPWVRVDLMGFLFGDILAVSRQDIAVIIGGGLLILVLMAWIWRPLLAATVNEDLARAEGLHPDRVRVIFMLLLATVIAIAMKLVGILLITAMLIIPAATARRVSATPETMAAIASVLGAISVIVGLEASLVFDTPSGPSIVVGAFVLFLASLLPIWKRRRDVQDSRP